MIRSIIFDWGDVVAPNAGGGWVRALANLLDIDFETALSIWRVASPGLNTGNTSEADFWSLVQQQINTPLPEHATRIWLDGLANEPHAQMVSYIASLRQRGLKVAVLSNTIKPMEEIMDFSQVFSMFDVRVFSHMLGFAKPDPRIYIHTLELLSCKADECVFIDDQLRNVDAAQELGIHAVHASKDCTENIAKLEEILNAKGK